jgi:excisionase family DNA binding protein
MVAVMATHSQAPGIKPAYTIQEVAAVLKVHRATVYRFIKRRDLRVSVLGHRTHRISHEALMDFLREHEKGSTR